jgi:hypothetical protein
MYYKTDLRVFFAACLVVLMGASAIAQQAVPPPAPMGQPVSASAPGLGSQSATANNGPSLDETMRFLISHPDMRWTENLQDGSPMVLETYNFASPAACTLAWSEIVIADDGESRDNTILDLSRVDPSQVTVTGTGVGIGTVQGIFLKGPFRWIRFSGTPPVYGKKDRGAWAARMETDLAAWKLGKCPTGLTGCTSRSQDDGSGVSLDLYPAELASQFAAAIRQAALLCKSNTSSPF